MDLGDFLEVVWRRRIVIILVTAALTASAVAYSLVVQDLYQAKAVIMPVNRKMEASPGMSVFAQQLGVLPGLSLPASASASEIMSLLRSNALRAQAINEHALMRLFFPERWDAGEEQWAGPAAEGTLPPTIWDGLRRFDSMLSVNSDIKENTITVSVRHNDPEAAAKIVDSLVKTLMERMSGEAKRIAMMNQKYLEGQLYRTVDPIIRQKVYNLIAQQMEVSMMSEMKDDFAFTVIDPPMVPDRRISPNRKKIAAVSGIFSLLVGAFAAFLLEYRMKRKGASAAGSGGPCRQTDI